MPDARIPATHVGILESALLATVSTIRHEDGLISTNPVGFDWDGEFVRLSTLKSRVKYRNLAANPLITFCVVDPQMQTRYIEIRGYAELIDDPEGAADFAARVKEHALAATHPGKYTGPLDYWGSWILMGLGAASALLSIAYWLSRQCGNHEKS